MASVKLTDVKKVYDNKVTSVHDFNLEIKDKEFVVFVGPSGCGKSTTLRMIAGLEDITEGTVEIDGVVVNDLQPKDRDIAMVFQNYALYPHMTVYDNIAFSLRLKKLRPGGEPFGVEPAPNAQVSVLEAGEEPLLLGARRGDPGPGPGPNQLPGGLGRRQLRTGQGAQPQRKLRIAQACASVFADSADPGNALRGQDRDGSVAPGVQLAGQGQLPEQGPGVRPGLQLKGAAPVAQQGRPEIHRHLQRVLFLAAAGTEQAKGRH